MNQTAINLKLLSQLRDAVTPTLKRDGLYTIKDAARHLGISRSLLYKKLNDETISAVKLGRRTLIAVEILDAYIKSLPPAYINMPSVRKRSDHISGKAIAAWPTSQDRDQPDDGDDISQDDAKAASEVSLAMCIAGLGDDVENGRVENRPDGSVVYFVQCAPNGPIKIGTTSARTLKSRLSQLQVSSPVLLRLIGVVKGNSVTEARAHFHLNEHKLIGEWFKANEAVIQYVEKALLLQAIPEKS